MVVCYSSHRKLTHCSCHCSHHLRQNSSILTTSYTEKPTCLILSPPALMCTAHVRVHGEGPGACGSHPVVTKRRACEDLFWRAASLLPCLKLPTTEIESSWYENQRLISMSTWNSNIFLNKSHHKWLFFFLQECFEFPEGNECPLFIPYFSW